MVELIAPEPIAELSLLFSELPLVGLKRQRQLEARCAKQQRRRRRRQANETSDKCKRRRREQHWPARKTRQTLHFFGTPLNSLPSSLMFLSLSLSLLLLLPPLSPLSPIDRQSSSSVWVGLASASETPPSSALVANSIFDSILGRTSNEAANSNSSAASSISRGSGTGGALVGASSNSNSDNNNDYYSRSRNSKSNSNENSAAQSSLQLASQAAAAAAADLHQSYKIGQTSDKVTLPGDILLGGLFPIHMKGTSGTKVECGEINRDRGIQRLEAMLYALDKINEDSRLLPDIKLGAILLDSCSSSTYALNQSLEFIRASINTVESSAFECKDKSTPRPKYGSKMIAGVIGGSYSEVSLQVANLLRLFRIPQVSYASTGTALSDKTLYDLFARTVPSDMFQARAIADIVLRLNWSYVSLVSSEGLYGDSGSKEFMKQASVRRICIATHEKVSPTLDRNAYDSIVLNLLKRNATGVVLITRAEDTRELLLAVKRAQLSRHNFTWVAADGWGTHQELIKGVEEVALGAITVELQAKVIPGFDQYMKALTPWQNGRNPWFSEYWQEWFDCQLQQNLLQQQQLASGPSSSFYLPSDAPLASHRSDHAAGAWSTSEFSSTTGEDSSSDYSGESVASAAAAARRRRSDKPPNERKLASWNNTAPAEVKVTGTTKRRVQEGGEEQQQRRHKRSPLSAEEMKSAKEMKQFCSPNLRISESNGYRQEQKVQFVVDAVYAMAHALHKAWANLCDAQPGVVCEALKELNGGEFYSKYLLNVSFKDLAGSEVKFDELGDGIGRYNIYNYRRRSFLAPASGAAAAATLDVGGDEIPAFEGTDLVKTPAAAEQTISNDGVNGDGVASVESFASGDQEQHIYTSNAEFEYSIVGRWTESDYNLKLDDIQFIQGDSLIPESFCSRPCELGQAKIMRAGDHCCWICKTCASYEFLPDEFSCKDCGIGRWPIQNKTSCFELPQKYLRWDSIYSLISLSIACLGIGLTLFVSIIFIKYLDTPVVKASGRELSFILLAGIAFCHLSTFVLLAKPTTFICGSQRFLVNFGFSLMYASLLVKTNRISRIFNCARKSAKRPSFISPRSQMLITGILVAIQIFLTIVWFVFEPPGIRADSPEGKRDEVILKCRAKGKSFIISLVYNMILITTCTVYAVKTRKIPENFNESKFIGFTMYTTIVIWLAFVTMFFGTNNSYEIQINTMCVCISLSAYVTLFCLFSPKVSIILLHPDKNVRKLTMNSATYKRPFKQVSSHASIEGGKNGGMNTYSMGTGAGGYTTTGSGANQPDGPSGGPMSTTSNNMLNPVDSQAASRLRESSIVSNVVNSNSAGSQSNCSQSKTPTTLSQQQLILGAATCANCGAHQQHQLNQQQPQLAPGKQPPTDQTNHSGRQLKVSSNRSTATSTTANANQQIGRSSVLVSSSRVGPQAGGNSQGMHQANVLHCGRNGKTADDSQLVRAITTTTTASAARPGDAIASSRDLLMKKRQMASLSKLNEIQADNQRQHHEHRSCVVGADESSSSLANDSFNLLNTSQENTPCNMPIGHAVSKQRHVAAGLDDAELAGCGHYISGKGSDSMLWNQSDNSIDYCSDCCPSSYCHGCSCPACLSSNGVGAAVDSDLAAQPNGPDALICLRNSSVNNVHSTTTSTDRFGANVGDVCAGRVGGSVDYIYHAHPAGETTGADDELDDEIGTRGLAVDDDYHDYDDDDDENNNDDYDIVCNRHRHHYYHSNQSNIDGDPASSRRARIRRRKSEEPTRYCMDVEEPANVYLMAAGATNQQHRDSLSSTARGARKTSSGCGGGSGSGDKRRSQQIMELQTINRDGVAELSSQGSLEKPAASSIAFALQTAAHSALGACAAGAQVTGDDGPQRTMTSKKDKPSEKAATSQQQQKSTSSSAGPIQASIELVKQVSHQMQQQQLWSRKVSTSYHDDYEYSYGLVQPPAAPEHSDTIEDNHDGQQQLIPADAGGACSGRPTKVAGSHQSALGQRTRNASSKYELPEESVVVAAGDYVARSPEGPNYREELLYDGRDRDDDHDDENNDDDDDFEHDGRLSLNRSSVSSGSAIKATSKQRHSSARPIRAKPAKSRGKQQPAPSSNSDGHRINSVTLIAATLSAGGAIVESGSGSSSGNKQPDKLESSAQQQQQHHHHQTEQRAHLH